MKWKRIVDRLGDICYRGTLIGISALILSSYIPIEPITALTTNIVSAAGGGFAANKLAEANISYSTDESDVDIEVNTELKVNANHRSLAFLDASKIVNVNNTQKSDYKPQNLKEKLKDIVPEYNFADITEYQGFSNSDREHVFVDDNKITVPDYKYKLEYLINNNIINRTTDYIYDETGVYMGMDRLIHAPTDSDISDEDIGDSENSGANRPRYWDPSKRISKTDFLVELLKTGKVQESRPIAVQTNYCRTDENLRTAEVIQEPIELSPYQSQMGQLGIDSVNNDIVVKHDVFKQLNFLITNDVVEAYLYDALNRNVITKDEIGGDEGSTFLSALPTGKFSPPGSWYETDVLRQFYDINTTAKGDGETEEDVESKLSGKQLATDDDGNILDSYPKDIESYQKVITAALDQSEITDGLDYPWGNSYYYSVDACSLGNPTAKNPTEIIKRFSCVDVDQGMMDTIRYSVTGESDKGYRYFENEDITLAGAYVLTYKFMIANGEEPHINQQEIDYINSTYALDFDGLLTEEIEAVQYLIAKGILDPKIENISSSTATQLTNEIAVDLLYRVANKNYRCSFTPTLTDEEKNMLNRGYSQASINLSSDPLGPSAEPLAINYHVGDMSSGSILDSLISDRIKHPANYDYMYIKMPKGVFNEDRKPTAVVHLVVNNAFRTILDPYNNRLNGGVAEYDIPERRLTDSEGNPIPELDSDGNPRIDKKGNTIYKLKWETNVLTDYGEEMHNENYAYRDFDGNYWVRYIVPKESSTNLRMLVNWSGGKVDEYNGFSGEGVYYLQKDEDRSYSKITLTNAETSQVSNVKAMTADGVLAGSEGHTLYNQVISVDTSTRRYLNNNKSVIYALTEVNAEIPCTDKKFKINNDRTYVETEVRKVREYFEELSTETTTVAATEENQPTNKSLSGGVQKQGSAFLGPLDIVGLKNLLLSDVNLIKFDESGQNPSIAVDNFNNKLDYKLYVERMSLKKEGESGAERWYIVYNPIGISVETELAYIYKEFNTKINGTYTTKTPGFAKYNSSGDEIAIVSKEEIESWSADKNSGLNIVILSDKMLYNANTGQRAFINTDEHFTMIGNNITRYPEDTMMCNTYGGKVFYNLDVIMELFADVDAVADKSGSSVFITTQKTNCMSDKARYRLVTLRDANVDGEPTYVDKTYALEDSGNIFLCLSALSDRASNMIYFKDTTHPGIEFLIVYYPKVTQGTLEHASSVNNGLIASMQSGDTVITSSNKSFEKQTAVLSTYLFSGGGGDNLKQTYDQGTVAGAAADVLPSGYQYDIYMLGIDDAEKPNNVSWADFVSIFQGVRANGMSGLDVLKNTVMDNTLLQIYPEGLENTSANFDKTNISLKYLPTQLKANTETSSTGTKAGRYVFRDLASHNLYFRLVNSDGTTNEYEYASFFKNRMFAESVDDGNGNKITASKLINKSTGMPLTSRSGVQMSFNEPTILFNRQKYYYKTPEGMVPAEVYSLGNVTVGTLDKRVWDNTSPNWKLFNEGKILINDNADFKVEVIRNTSGKHSVFSGNIQEPFQTLQGEKVSDLGVFTPLRSQKVQILSGDGNKRQCRLFDNLAAAINGNADVYKPTTVLDYFDREMAAIFQSEYPKSSSSSGGMASGYADSSGTPFFAPKAIRDSVAYGTKVGQTSTNPEFNGSLAGMYECTWDFFNLESEKVFYESIGTEVTEETAFFNNGFKTFTSVKGISYTQAGTYTGGNASNASQNDYFFTFTVGRPSVSLDSMVNTTDMYGVTDNKSIGSNVTNYSKYIKTDDPYIFITLCRRNMNNFKDSKAVAMAGIPLSDLYFDNVTVEENGSAKSISGIRDSILTKVQGRAVTGYDVIEYLFDRAWNIKNTSNIYLTRASSEKNCDLYKEISDAYINLKGAPVTYKKIQKYMNSTNAVVPIYYQPTFAAPAGTTVVTGDGRLRTFASDRIRCEINYLSDINNGILAKYLLTNADYTSVTFLCEVPDYAEIAFEGDAGEASTVFYKLGGTNARNSKGLMEASKMSWVPTMMYKKPDGKGGTTTSKVIYSNVNDLTLAYQLYTSIFNIEIPTMSSQSLANTESNATAVSNGSKIRLGNTLGSGLWRLPLGGELTGLVQSLQKISGSQNSNADVFLNGLALEKNYPVWCYSTDITKDLKDTSSYRSYVAEALLYTYSTNTHQFKIADRMQNASLFSAMAYLHPVFNLPPTLVVEQDTHNSNRYIVKYYVNPELFGMDVNNKYIAYLKSRDTPAEEIVSAMGQMRSSNFDGNMFKIKVFMDWLSSLLKDIWIFIQYVIPLILLVLWLITTVLYGAVHYLPITHYYLGILQDRLGFDIVAFVTCGVLGTNKVTKLSAYVLYSCVIFTLMALVYMSMLQTSLLQAWDIMIHGL